MALLVFDWPRRAQRQNVVTVFLRLLGKSYETVVSNHVGFCLHIPKWGWRSICARFKNRQRRHPSTDKRRQTLYSRLPLSQRQGSPEESQRQHGHPLNLRRANLYLVGCPNGIEGRKGRANTDTRAHLREQAALRAQLAGQDYGMGDVGSGQ